LKITNPTMVHRIKFCWVAFDLTNIMHIAHQNSHTRLVAKSSWKPYKRTQRTWKSKRNEQLIWAHKICKNKKKFECILEKNASTKNLVTTPSSNKIHHYTMNDNEHKGKRKLFCCLEFEITKTWKISNIWMHILQH